MEIEILHHNVVQRLAVSRSRLQPQIGCGCGQDFDERAAAGGYAPSAVGYGIERSLKLDLKNLNVFTTLIYQCPMRRFPHESIRPSKWNGYKSSTH